jgi:RimJ/RimL family protein N-acetyltransferase
MHNLLIFIKHRLRFIWGIIEWVNNALFTLLFRSRLERVLAEVYGEIDSSRFTYRRLNDSDMHALWKMIDLQEPNDLNYFHPHDFDLKSIRKQIKKGAFLMMGTFDQDRLIGYFFLRFFINRKCFVGRLIDKEYRGKGIGNQMNPILYEIAWRMNFRCLSTISRNNKTVQKAHAKNHNMYIIKELQNNYLLVEFRKVKNAP